MAIGSLNPDSVGYAVLVLSAVATIGLTIGNFKAFGVKLGIAGVLFAGLAASRLGFVPNEHLTEFLREFGLILFVYTIGMQLGPGFFASFRREGLRLNALAAVIAAGGFAIAVLIGRLTGFDPAVVIGLFSGATTNTPSLAAAQEALKAVPQAAEDAARLTTAGYAVAYPFGILGIILVMLGIRAIFRVNVEREAEAFGKTALPEETKLHAVNLRVTNPNLQNVLLKDVPALSRSGVVSRLLHEGRVTIPKPRTPIHLGDVLLVVGTARRLEELRVIVGEKAPMDLRAQSSAVTSRRIVVTRRSPLGKSLAELNLAERLGVNVTRVIRTEIEIAALPSLKLQFGDVLVAVGEDDGLRAVAAEFGNSPGSLAHPQLVPMFLGIALGIVLGQLPLAIPGMAAPVRLGYAGGPLVAAILLSNIGRIGRIVWYMPVSANFAFRETGIVMFLAAVGLRSGPQFFSALSSGEGYWWMLAGAALTFVPLALTALAAKTLFKMNYLTLCGLLSGSMTDPPALAYAGSISPSSASAIAYAAVYPLTMLLRIVLAQVLVAFFFR